jgi:hypothetical protein
MKKIYFILAIFSLSIFAGCSKDFLKSYDKRIEGTWNLVDIDRYGFGSTSTQFRNGLFTFLEDGDLVYEDENGQTYNGSWNINRRWVRGNCYTDEDGSTDCDDRQVRTLSISVVNFTTQEFRAEYYDEMRFIGTNRFNATIYLGAGSCVFRFRRQ